MRSRSGCRSWSRKSPVVMASRAKHSRWVELSSQGCFVARGASRNKHLKRPLGDSAGNEPLMAKDIAGDAHQIIADLRCELALRTAERDEALAQQTATSEVLQVINSSPGDLAPVFEAMLEKALRLCGASFGMLRTFDGEFFHTAAMKGVPPALQNAWLGPTRPAPGGAQERLVRGERFLHFADAREDEGYRRGYPTSRALVDL